MPAPKKFVRTCRTGGGPRYNFLEQGRATATDKREKDREIYAAFFAMYVAERVEPRQDSPFHRAEKNVSDAIISATDTQGAPASHERERAEILPTEPSLVLVGRACPSRRHVCPSYCHGQQPHALRGSPGTVELGAAATLLHAKMLLALPVVEGPKFRLGELLRSARERDDRVAFGAGFWCKG